MKLSYCWHCQSEAKKAAIRRIRSEKLLKLAAVLLCKVYSLARCLSCKTDSLVISKKSQWISNPPALRGNCIPAPRAWPFHTMPLGGDGKGVCAASVLSVFGCSSWSPLPLKVMLQANSKALAKTS